ncbi:MAG: MATE family efflux transporter [Bacteroidetes bacterium]|nr:MATE family efflux transporter [Bacteroidota bacterium]
MKNNHKARHFLLFYLPVRKITTFRWKSFYRDLYEAISGSEQDFTQGSLRRAIFLLSIPMVLEMLMESIFAIVDIFFVSRLGADAVATVGLTESMLTIVYSLGVGFAMGATALVSRRIGEKDPEAAATSGFQAIIIGVVFSVPLAIAGIFYAGDLLELMGASPELIESYSGYLRIMLGSNVVIMLLFINNAIFRSAGDAVVAMRVLWFANILNIILDPLLIFGLGPFPELGIEGAAIATVIGRGLAVIYQFYLLFRGSTRIVLRKKNFRIIPNVMTRLIRLSSGNIGQYLIATASWIGMVRIISEFGSEVLAGYTIAIRIIIFALLPTLGISNAAATLVGQNLGAGKPDRAERSVWGTSKINVVILGMIGLMLVAIPEFFIGMFIGDPAVLKSGSACLRIIASGFLFYGFGMVLVNSFNGAGDTMTPLWINLFCFWVVEIPLAYFLAITSGIGENGVYYAILIAESLMTITAFVIFRRGRWKLKVV